MSDECLYCHTLGGSEIFKRTILILLAYLVSDCTSPANESTTDENEISEHIIDLPEQIAALENLTVYPPDIEPAYEIKLEREQRFGSTDDVKLLVGGPPGSLASVDEKGRVFIPDRQQQTIHVLDPDGSYVTRLGGQGEGPGEFSNISSVIIGDDQLYVWDSGQLKLEIFLLETFSHTNTVQLMRDETWSMDGLEESIPDHFYLRSDGTLLGRFWPLPDHLSSLEDPDFGEQNRILYFLINDEGSVIPNKVFDQRSHECTVTHFGGNPQAMILPIDNHPLMALSVDDHIFSAWTEDFLIKVYDSEGTYLRGFYYPDTKSSLDRQDLVNLYDHLPQNPALQAARTVDLPDTWPALHSMQMDDENRLWVSTITDDQQVYLWWILDEYGELLARFNWPRDQSIEKIRNGYLYSTERDNFDEMFIIRYRIVLE